MGSRNASAWRAQERGDLRVVFRPEHRAGRVEQQPAGARHGQSASSSRACWRAKPATSDSRRSHLPSGWRRTTPEAVQGTSARMRSNGRPSHHVGGRAGVAGDDPSRRASASCRRARLSRTRSSRAASAVERDDARRRRARAGAPSCRRAPRRRRARACPRRGPQQRRRELRAEILHRERALAVAGQLGDRPRRLDDHAGLARGLAPIDAAAQAATKRLARGHPPFTRNASGGRSLPAARIACQSSG